VRWLDAIATWNLTKFLQSTLVAVLKHRNHICPMFPRWPNSQGANETSEQFRIILRVLLGEFAT
jgi:hypothetical protein